jgi:hypothetical protein
MNVRIFDGCTRPTLDQSRQDQLTESDSLWPLPECAIVLLILAFFSLLKILSLNP